MTEAYWQRAIRNAREVEELRAQVEELRAEAEKLRAPYNAEATTARLEARRHAHRAALAEAQVEELELRCAGHEAELDRLGHLQQPFEWLEEERDCAEGRMVRTGWVRSDNGYQWTGFGPDAGLDKLVKAHRGVRTLGGTWIGPHVERITFHFGGGMKHLPRLAADTLLGCVKAAEAWIEAQEAAE